MFCMVVQKAQLGLFYQLQIIKSKKSLSNGLGIIFTFCLGLYVFFVFEYSIFWIHLYIVTDTADFLQSNIIHIKLEINNVCLVQSFILELHYKNKSTKSFELPNITDKILNFRFEMCKKCIFHTLVNIFLNSSNWALQF